MRMIYMYLTTALMSNIDEHQLADRKLIVPFLGGTNPNKPILDGPRICY